MMRQPSFVKSQIRRQNRRMKYDREERIERIFDIAFKKWAGLEYMINIALQTMTIEEIKQHVDSCPQALVERMVKKWKELESNGKR